MSAAVDFEVRTAADVLMATFDRRHAAVTYARENDEAFPGVYVTEVQHREPLRRRIHHHLRVVAA